MRPSGCAFALRCAFVEPRCLEQVPPLVDVTGTMSQAACVRANELGSRNGQVGTDEPEYHQILDPGETVLKLDDIRKTFRMRGRFGAGESFAALNSVDLELRQGECLGIVGESGCGKSTLLRVIAGLTKADGGSCVFAEGAKAQMVFQDAGASLTPWLPVGEQIGERLAHDMGRRERRDAVARALEAVGLPAEVAGARPRQLSGGQKQRVALARAIVVPPALLLCDEPTSSLDVSLAATVLNLIADLRQKLRMTVVFVTHDLAAARLIADRIAVMYLGRIVEIGPAEALVDEPGHPYTKALIAAVPGEHSVRPKAKGELPDPVSPPPGCPYHPRCAEARPDCALREMPLVAFGRGGSRLGACVHLEES
jgi:peptide/nickel transport system ATP-binding protein